MTEAEIRALRERVDAMRSEEEFLRGRASIYEAVADSLKDEAMALEVTINRIEKGEIQ